MSEGPYTLAENSNMPSSELVTVLDKSGNAAQLQHNAAASWASLLVASGNLISISPNGAYRDVAHQTSYKGSHGWGTCVDIWSSSGNNWAINNFPAAGWARDRWVPGSAETSANEWNHWHYVGPLNRGADNVPYLNAIDWATPTAVGQLIGSATWTRLPRASTPSYDIAPILGGAGLWHLEVNFWISGLAAGQSVVARVAEIAGTPIVYTQEYYPITIEGSSSGSVRQQYTSIIRVVAGRSVVVEVQGSTTGIVVDQWHARVLNWQA